jgi:Domain of unknown function (DUF4397)
MRKQGLRTAWSWLVATILLGLWLLAAVPAAAGAQSGQAMVRVVHLSAGAPRVDLDVDGTRMLSAVPFRTASRYARMPAGTHTLVVRSGGSASSTAAASARMSAQAGAAYTAFLLGSPTQPQVRVAKDDFSAPPPGKAKLRIVNAAPQSPPLDIGIAGGSVLFRNVGFGRVSGFVTIAAGKFSLEVRAAGTSTVLFTQGATTLPAGTIITVAGTITSAGKIETLPILDAAGAGRLPLGGVATGAGGTAGGAAGAPARGALGLLLAVGLLAAIAEAARRRLLATARAGR